MASSSVSSGLNLPSGFKFLPTNQELLGYYLLNKVRGKPFKCDSRVMNEYNLYKTSPWELWNRFGGPRLNQGEDLFIFTELKKVNDSGSNVCRTAGSGTWKGDTAGTKVYDLAEDNNNTNEKNKMLLGTWKRFHYVSNVPNENGSWIMLEYKLDDSLIPKSCSSRDLVLCRIRKDRKRKLNEDQMNDAPRRKVPRLAERHDSMSTQELATKFEEPEQQQQHHQLEFDSDYKGFEEQEDPQLLPSSSQFHEQQQQFLGNDMMMYSDPSFFQSPETSELPNANITYLQPDNLGIPSDIDKMLLKYLGDSLMVSSHDAIFQRVAEGDHGSYGMSAYEEQFLNEENNLLTPSSLTSCLSSDEEKQQPQEQQQVKHNIMCEGQQSSPVDVQSISSIPIEKDESQFDDYLIVDEFGLLDTNNEPYPAAAAPDAVPADTPQPLQMQDSAANDSNKTMRIDESHDQTQLEFPSHDHSNTMRLSADSAAHYDSALKFSTLEGLDDNVFNQIDLENLWG